MADHRPLPVLDVTEYTDRNAHWSAEASDPYPRTGSSGPARRWRLLPSTPLPGLRCSSARVAAWERGLPYSASLKAFTNVPLSVIPLLPLDEAWYWWWYPHVTHAAKCRGIATTQGHIVDCGFFEGRSPAPPTAAPPAAGRVPA